MKRIIKMIHVRELKCEQSSSIVETRLFTEMGDDDSSYSNFEKPSLCVCEVWKKEEVLSWGTNLQNGRVCRKDRLERGDPGSRAERVPRPLLHSRLRRLSANLSGTAGLFTRPYSHWYLQWCRMCACKIIASRSCADAPLALRSTYISALHSWLRGRCPKPVSRYSAEIIMARCRNLNNYRIKWHFPAHKRERIIYV